MTRPDATQSDIVNSLRQAGIWVWVIGQPCDLLTYFRGCWLPLEAKPIKKRRRKDQEKQDEFLKATNCPVVRSFQEAYTEVLAHAYRTGS